MAPIPQPSVEQQPRPPACDRLAIAEPEHAFGYLRDRLVIEAAQPPCPLGVVGLPRSESGYRHRSQSAAV